jgi:hypothetical protein
LVFSGAARWVFAQWLDWKGVLQSDEVRKLKLRIQRKILQEKRFFTPISRKPDNGKASQRFQETP